MGWGRGPEVAVGDPVERLKVEPEPLQKRSDHGAGHAIGAVGDDLQGLHLVRVDEAHDPLVVSVVDVDRLARSRRRAGPGARLDRRADVADAGVAGRGEGPLADELDARVRLRVVRGGDHGPPSSSREPTSW